MNGSYTITEPIIDRSTYFTSNYNNQQSTATSTATSPSMMAHNPRHSSTSSTSSGNQLNRFELSKTLGHSHSKSGDLNKSPSSKNLSHVPCKFFRQGACQAGSSCPFSHATDLTSESQPCKYFQKGNCKFGVKCALAHILPDGRRVNPKSLQQAYQQHQAQAQQQNGNYSLVGNSRSARHSFSGSTEPVAISSYKSPFGSHASLSSSYDNNSNSFSTTPTSIQSRLFMSTTNNSQSNGVPISINTSNTNAHNSVNSTSPYGGNSIWSSTTPTQSSPNGSFFDQSQPQPQPQSQSQSQSQQQPQGQSQAQQSRFLRSLSGSSYQRLSFSTSNPSTASTPVNYINAYTNNGSITPTRTSSFGGNNSTSNGYYSFTNSMNSLSLSSSTIPAATAKNDNAIVDSDDDLNDHYSGGGSQRGSFSNTGVSASSLISGFNGSTTPTSSSYNNPQYAYNSYNNGNVSNAQQQVPSSSGSYNNGKLMLSQENEEAIIEEEEPSEEVDFLPDSLNDLLTPQELKRRLSRPSFNSGNGGRPLFASASGDGDDTQFVME